MLDGLLSGRDCPHAMFVAIAPNHSGVCRLSDVYIAAASYLWLDECLAVYLAWESFHSFPGDGGQLFALYASADREVFRRD